jgi:hypothetical protein
MDEDSIALLNVAVIWLVPGLAKFVGTEVAPLAG